MPGGGEGGWRPGGATQSEVRGLTQTGVGPYYLRTFWFRTQWFFRK